MLPNEENAPELSVTAREELFHYLNKSHTLKVVRRGSKPLAHVYLVLRPSPCIGVGGNHVCE